MGMLKMAIGYTILGFFVAMGSGMGAALMGASLFGIIAFYSLAGAAVLFAVLAASMFADRGQTDVFEDAMLIPGE